MAINRSSIRDLLLPGLAGLEGKYPQIPARYPEIFYRVTSKMATERYAEMRYTGLAQLKQEGSQTFFDNASGERYVYNAVMNSIGLGFAMTREVLEDNLYADQFNPGVMGLMESFAQTKDIFGANLINNATTYNAQIGGDGVAILATNHPIDNGTWANTPTTAIDLNEASLEYALNTIRTFPDQAGLLAMTRGEKLVVPINLQFVAERLTKTEYRVGTNNNDVSAIYTTGALPGGYTVNEFLTAPYGWYILTNVKGLVCFDRTPLELDLQVEPTTGNLLVIGFERYTFSERNPRGIWGTIPTS